MAKLKTAATPPKFKLPEELGGENSITSKSSAQVISLSAAGSGVSASDEGDHPDLDIAYQILSRPHFEGHFDAINKCVVEGWAYSPEIAQPEVWKLTSRGVNGIGLPSDIGLR